MEDAQAWSKASFDIADVRRMVTHGLDSASSPQEQLPWRTMSNVLDAFSQMLKEVTGEVKQLSRSLNDHAHSTATTIDSLLDDAKNLLMISCSSIFAGFPLLVRQLSKQLGKEVELTISGGEIELDRRILGQLKEPLIHILRNCVDHGIEAPTDRRQMGKPARGSLRLTTQAERMVELRISDDGRGIDATRLKASAVTHGVLTREEADKLPAHEALRLIFRSAVSTSASITEISGRGLGMAVVEGTVEKLGGSITVETEPGNGTTFILRLPLTIATFRAVLLKASGQLFAIPTANVERVIEIGDQSLRVLDGSDTFLLEDTLVPLGTMEEMLGLRMSFKKTHLNELVTVAVVRSGQDRLGLMVDDVLSEQELLVKNLGPVFRDVTGVLGASVLPSGQVVPILNIRHAQRISSALSRRQPASRTGGIAQ